MVACQWNMSSPTGPEKQQKEHIQYNILKQENNHCRLTKKNAIAGLKKILINS